ncbi:hypothetical protein C4552_04465 [Candidatus Parcubacteria bacterium]|nr:MAG: hypothetical protein C4552_04465 [Candidatus Parcubacteria bacterium]
MNKLPEIFILFDTEYTSWEGAMDRNWSGPNEYRELVQIGAIRVDGRTLAETADFTVYARPEKNPELSAFFMELTGISQATVDADGLRFPEAIGRFAAWVGDDPLYCWGGDRAVLEENCRFHAMAYPLADNRHGDIRALFQAAGITTVGYASSTIVRAFGQEPARRAHDALNDARQILDALRLLQASRSTPRL